MAAQEVLNGKGAKVAVEVVSASLAYGKHYPVCTRHMGMIDRSPVHCSSRDQPDGAVLSEPTKHASPQEISITGNKVSERVEITYAMGTIIMHVCLDLHVVPALLLCSTF